MNNIISNAGRKLAAVAVAMIALAATAAAPALAAPGMATGNVNVRMGPGVNFHTVDFLRYGDKVSIGQCKYGWCFVSHGGADGWVSQKYLVHAVRPHAAKRDYKPQPNIGIYFGFGGHKHFEDRQRGGNHHWSPI